MKKPILFNISGHGLFKIDSQRYDVLIKYNENNENYCTFFKRAIFLIYVDMD